MIGYGTKAGVCHPNPIKFPYCVVIGSRVYFPTLEQVIELMEEWIERWPGDRARQIVVTGFHGLWEAYRSPELHRILNGADLWVPDGIAPVWVARWRGLKMAHRTPGTDIMRAFFQLATKKGYASFFYGDTEETLQALQLKLQSVYPGHRIAGILSPPFRPLTAEEDERHLHQINSSGAHVLWVGLGTPKQDRWIWERRERLRVPIAVGVGAAFRFLAGLVPRCPQWLGNAGFEWLWRLLFEPRKLWKRDLVDGPRFLVSLLADELKRARR